MNQLLEEEGPAAPDGDPAFSPFLLQTAARKLDASPSPRTSHLFSCSADRGRLPGVSAFDCLEVWHDGRFSPVFVPYNASSTAVVQAFARAGVCLTDRVPVPVFPGSINRLQCLLVPLTCPTDCVVALICTVHGQVLGEVLLFSHATAASVAVLCGRDGHVAFSLAGSPWRSPHDGFFHGMCLRIHDSAPWALSSPLSEGGSARTSGAATASMPALLLEAALGRAQPCCAFPISLAAGLARDVNPVISEGLAALRAVAVFLQETLKGIQPFPLYPGLEGVALPPSTQSAWHCISPPWVGLATAPPGAVLHLFTDGATGPHAAGYSVVAFLAEPLGSWHFQGVWGSSSKARFFCESAHDSAEAECCGVAAALLWSLSLPSSLGCCIHVDCDFPRLVFEGLWCPAWEAPAAVWLIRHLAHLTDVLSRNVLVCSVAGHSSHPWNDLADTLAKRFASTSPGCFESVSWTPTVCSLAFSWAWLLPLSAWHRSLPLVWDVVAGTFDASSSCPRDLPSHFAANLVRRSRSESEWCTIDVSLASFNALSLADSDRELSASTGTAAQELLQTQFKALKVLLVGVQETRLPSSVAYSTCSHWVASSACTGGQGGCALWVDLSCPYGCDGRGNELFLSAKNCRPLVASSRMLIVRIRAKGLSLLVVVGHSHHSRSPEEVRVAWWQDLAGQLRRCAKAGDSLILLLDANARLGKPTSSGIGSVNADPANANGACLSRLVEDFGLCLPATFPCHSGPSATWLSPVGTEARIDFIAIPRDWLPSVTRSWVMQDLDTVRATVDHKPCLVHVSGLRRIGSRPDDRMAPKYVPDPAQAGRWSQGLSSIGHVPWSWDTDLHLQQMSGSLTSLMRKCNLAQAKVPRQPYVTDQILSLVAFRKHTRSFVDELRRQARHEFLSIVFLLWKRGCEPCSPASISPATRVHMRLACGIRALQLSSRDLRAMLRAAKADYVRGLAQAFQHTSHHGSTRELYAALYKLHPSARKKSSLRPLLQVRGQAGDPLLDEEAVSQRWAQHWADIEGGEVQEISSLVSAYSSYQADRDRPCHDWRQLPTRGQWESRFHHLDGRKAAGSDGLSHSFVNIDRSGSAALSFPLALKVAVHAHEPLRWRGGSCFPLFKKGDATLCQNYRSILVSELLAKRYHSWLRSSLKPAFDSHRASGQHGVTGGGTTALLQLWVRQFQSHAASRGLSSGLLFTDVRSAFYTTLRPFIGVRPSPLSFPHWCLSVGLASDEAEMLETALLMDSFHLDDVAGPFLRDRVQDVLCSTWFSVAGSSVVASSTKGSRPGDPLADILYGFVMASVLKSVQADFAEHQLSMRLTLAGILSSEGPADIPLVPAISWHDDAVFGFVADSAAQLESSAQQASRLVFQQFRQRGFEMSFAAGETELLLSPQGKGSQAVRKSLFAREPPAIYILPDFGHALAIRLVRSYQHLGSLVELDARLQPEIKRRLAQAHGAASTFRSKVFACPHVAPAARRTLFRSLVISRLVCNIGSWPLLLLQEQQLWQAGIIRLYKSLIPHLRHDAHVSALDIVRSAGMPLPLDLLRFERIRLFNQLATKDFRPLTALVEANIGASRCWLQAIMEDVRWLADLRPTASAQALCGLDLPGLWTFAQSHPVLLTSLVRSAWHAAVAKASQVGLVAPVPAPAQVLACPLCKASCKGPRGLSLHLAVKHNYRCRARFYAPDTICRCCHLQFSDRQKLLKHLIRRSPGCLIFLRRHMEPLTLAEELQATARENKRARKGIGVIGCCKPVQARTKPSFVERRSDSCCPISIEDVLGC